MLDPAIRSRLPTPRHLYKHIYTHIRTITRTELNLALVALFMPSLPVVTFYSSIMFELSVGQVRGFVEDEEWSEGMNGFVLCGRLDAANNCKNVHVKYSAM